MDGRHLGFVVPVAAPAGLASVPPGEGTSAAKGDGAARGDVCFVFCVEVFALSLARRSVSPALLAFKGEEMYPLFLASNRRDSGNGGQLRGASAKLFPNQRWWRRREGAGDAAGSR